MEKEKRKVPKLRFPGFTDEWEQRKLLDLLVQPVSDGPHETPDLVDDGIPFISVDAIVDNRIDFGRKRGYITEEYDLECRKKYSPQRDDVYLVKSGATVGKVAIVETDERFNIWSPLAAMRANKEVLLPKYLYFYLQLKDVQDEIYEKSIGGTQPNLSMRVLEQFQVKVPHIDEQFKISDALDRLDNLITLHQSKLDQIKEYKKGMLQKMFPKQGETVPEIRFPGFTGDWEQRKLGDLVSFSKGSGYSKGDLKEDGTPIILYGRLYTKYETVISEVDTFVDEKKGSVFSKGGEVIVPASGETAEDISIASVVEKSGVLLGGDLNVITPPGDLDSAFLAISISNGKPHNDMSKMAQGKSVVHLHNADLAKIDLPYPSHEEQQMISGFFFDIDNLITLHQRKLDQIKEYKKGLLQQMFA